MKKSSHAECLQRARTALEGLSVDDALRGFLGRQLSNSTNGLGSKTAGT